MAVVCSGRYQGRETASERKRGEDKPMRAERERERNDGGRRASERAYIGARALAKGAKEERKCERRERLGEREEALTDSDGRRFIRNMVLRLPQPPVCHPRPAPPQQQQPEPIRSDPTTDPIRYSSSSSPPAPIPIVSLSLYCCWYCCCCATLASCLTVLRGLSLLYLSLFTDRVFSRLFAEEGIVYFLCRFSCLPVTYSGFTCVK